MASDSDLLKQQIRARVRQQRANRGGNDLQQESEALTASLIKLATARGVQSVSCYLPVQNEPDTRGFVEWARQEGIEMLFPSVREDGLLDWIRPSWEGYVSGKYRIPEPLGEFVSPISVGEVDLMLIPACAVDRKGVRLGWGRGYFDKSLGSISQRPPVFAVVYDDEFVDDLPAELHDIPVTGVVTPERIEYLDQVL